MEGQETTVVETTGSPEGSGDVVSEAATDEIAQSDAAPVEEEVISIPKTEFEKLRSQLENSQSMIGKQAQDVGASRAKIKELEERVSQLSQVKQTMQSEYDNDPWKALETHTALSKAQELLAEENRKVIEHNNRFVFTNLDNAYEKRIDTMANMMLADGYTPQEVGYFKSNPYHVDQGIAIAYLNRAKEFDKIQELQSTLEKLNPKNVEQKIRAAADGGGRLTAASGGSVGGAKAITKEILDSMTSDQLKHLAKTGELKTN